MNNQKSALTFSLGIICLVIGIAILGFIIYILPYVLFGFNYDIPDFIVYLTTWLEQNHGITGYWQMLVLLLPPMIIGFLFLYLAREFSLTADNLEHISEPSPPTPAIESEVLPNIELGPTESIGDLQSYVKTANPSIAITKTRRKHKRHTLLRVLLYILLILLFLLVVEYFLVTGFEGRWLLLG